MPPRAVQREVGLEETDMDRFALPTPALRPLARLLTATAIAALGAAAGSAQTNEDVPRGASTIWFVQPALTLGGEPFTVGEAMALDVAPAASDATRTAQAEGTAQAESTEDAEPAGGTRGTSNAAAPEAEPADAPSDSDASADADADASAESGSGESEASQAESAVEPEDGETADETNPEESAILPSAEDQEETEAQTMAIDCVKRPEGCITPLENEVEGPSLSDTPQTPENAETDADGAVPVIVEN